MRTFARYSIIFVLIGLQVLTPASCKGKNNEPPQWKWDDDEKDNNGDGGNRNNKELTRNVEHEMCDHTVMIDATGIVTKGLKKNLEAMPEKHSVDSLQNTAILRTSYK
jgi:hypothetical protein